MINFGFEAQSGRLERVLGGEAQVEDEGSALMIV